MVWLRKTYATVRSNAASGATDAQQLALGRKLQEYFKPVGEVAFEGRVYKMSPEFGTTASARMDTAAVAVQALVQQPSSTDAYVAAVGELRAAQREHLEADGLLAPLFQELDMLERRMKSGGDRGTHEALLQLRSDISSMLRTHALTLYGGDF